ncbi:MAG TPA: SMC-Scp complex subunit ScpB [Polyangia bacterium]|nr:SMC-Scp complex subunit ScpB [Polyangia bacterium]
MKKRKKKGAADAAPVVGEAVTSAPEETTAPGGDGVPVGIVAEATAETTLEIQTELVTPPVEQPGVAEGLPEPPALDGPDPWDGPTAVGGPDEVAALAADSARGEDGAAEGPGTADVPAVDSAGRLESIVESLIFASDKPLGMTELKRLLNERDAKKITAALEAVKARFQERGIHLLGVAGGWQFRTNPDNGAWVSKLMVGRPARLSRAMLETLAIVAYRQPITRPEIDEIRGVDCGPVLKTLLERGMIRMIGKKEEVGRPILYGTTPEFLRTFSLRDLTELPTLREFHELGAAEMAKVDAEAPHSAASGEGGATGAPPPPSAMPPPTELPASDPDEEDALLAELDAATGAAVHASKAREAEVEAAAEANPTAPGPQIPEA